MGSPRGLAAAWGSSTTAGRADAARRASPPQLRRPVPDDAFTDYKTPASARARRPRGRQRGPGVAGDALAAADAPGETESVSGGEVAVG